MKNIKLKLKNSLFNKVLEIFSHEKRGRVLDLGCGAGDYANGLKTLGFDVVASDRVKGTRYKYHGVIDFKACDISEKLPFNNEEFDYVLFLETIEHIWEPYFCIKEINRILKKGGSLVISTPNILNINSRLRFLYEGSYDYFREPTLDYVNLYPDHLSNIHLIPWRYQNLEYLLSVNGLSVSNIYADILKAYLRVPYLFLLPIIKLQHYFKQKRVLKKGGINYERIYAILNSDEILYGKHLILKAVKE
ncbi:MAG: hypothetical protein COX96_05340 [Candidatus Omnitrophica bacterium CG_4_10_14_0_2_um_filter_44_9]|nr:MAG: hypothetical protein COY78_04215 [Candidatus Omnitrophica bacterium CG_4_10_14_0_8_um_filter_44_12]PIZ84146.1 MAG: hypothetical protein COX96_05340 [Candidatus Omnitrophica bacterium CG_4_10_14_0_2_um_filter_44_9]